MENNIDHLIVRHLCGEISQDEQQTLFKWINDNPDNEQYYLEFVEVWQRSSTSVDQYEPDTDISWAKFQEAVAKESQPSIRNLMPVFRSAGFYAIAASIALLIGVFLYVNKDSSSPSLTFSKETAERNDVFYLPDSTLVWLNKQSSLEFSFSADGNERVVNLKGQAFFDVKRNIEQPFIIYAEGTTIKVLGTSFDVKAYAGEDVEVNVVSGKVSFNAMEQSLLLTPSEKGIYKRNSNSLALVQTVEEASSAEVSWMNDQSYEGNLIYDMESKYPLLYTSHYFEWRDNLISQTVIDGEIKSNAKVCSYGKIYLKATYLSKKNKVENYHFTIEEKLTPGETLKYKKKLPGWFKDTRDVKIVIEKIDRVKN